MLRDDRSEGQSFSRKFLRETTLDYGRPDSDRARSSDFPHLMAKPLEEVEVVFLVDKLFRRHNVIRHIVLKSNLTSDNIIISTIIINNISNSSNNQKQEEEDAKMLPPWCQYSTYL